MIENDVCIGKPLVAYSAAKATIEALASLTAGSQGYASDTHAPGWLIDDTWSWLDITKGKTLTVTGSPTLAGDATLTLTTALTNNTGAGVLTWPAGGATFTIPATGTPALLATANVFTANQRITGKLGINTAPSYDLDVYTAAAATGVTYGSRFIIASTGTGTPVTLLFQVQQVDNIASQVRGIYGSAAITSASAAAGAINAAGNYATVVYTLSGAFDLDVTGKSSAFYAAVPTITKTGGGTMTVAEHAGNWIENQGFAGCTTSYGLYIAAQSGSGTNYAIRTYTGLFTHNSNLADDADFLLNGTTYALIQTDASDDELYICNNAAAKFSIFAAVPVARHAHIADATNAADVITTCNHILSMIEEYGFLATA